MNHLHWCGLALLLYGILTAVADGLFPVFTGLMELLALVYPMKDER